MKTLIFFKSFCYIKSKARKFSLKFKKCRVKSYIDGNTYTDKETVRKSMIDEAVV